MDEEKFNNHSDHDLLIILVTKVAAFEKQVSNQMEVLEKQFSNHLRHHFVYTLALVTAILSVAGAGLFFIMTKGV